MNEISKSIQTGSSPKPVGHQIHYYRQIGSTNDEAFRLAQAGAPHGTALIAEAQTAGKGRMQRIWHSPGGANLYTSVILRPDFEPARAPQIAIAAGVAVARTIDPFCPGRVELKWPNDVLLGGKKLCGILAQMKLSGGAVDFVVLGIGINIHLKRDAFPPDLRDIATSLCLETQKEISRDALSIRLYENLTTWYTTLRDSGFEPVRSAWLGYAPMIGRDVSVRFENEVMTGRAVGIDEEGSLILVAADGKSIKVSAGDATILKKDND